PQVSPSSRGASQRPLSNVYCASGSEPDPYQTSRPHTLQEGAPRCGSPAGHLRVACGLPPRGAEPPRDQTLQDSEGRGSARGPLTEAYLPYLRRPRWAAFAVEAPGRCVGRAGSGARNGWFDSQHMLVPECGAGQLGEPAGPRAPSAGCGNDTDLPQGC
ncbi:unnamed protein product, partial [Gulo gulo]